MDTFKKINWHPALEDMIDDVFVRDERMNHESAMYKIMSDQFVDPFKDMEDEYAEVNIELIKRLGGDELEEEVQRELETKYFNKKSKKEQTKKQDNLINKQDDLTNKQEHHLNNESQSNEKHFLETKTKSYIPGIRKQPFYFPRKSHLNKIQQAMCLRVLLRFTSNEKKIITEEEKIELQNYMSLQKIISNEQTEFLNFVKSKWNETAELVIKYPGFIKSKWETKMTRMQKLPKYYAECTNIPFSMDKAIKIQFSCCLQQGLLPEIILPKSNERKVLSTTKSNMYQRFIKMPSISPDKNIYSVSEDTYCESFAVKTKADLVISSSSLKCLLNNIDPSYSNSWLIPVVIRSHNGKNVIYIDKKLPPTIATVPQKNTWVYKYILRYCFDAKEIFPKRARNNERNKFDEDLIHSDKYEDSFDEQLRIAKMRILKKQNESKEAAICSDEGACSNSSNDQMNLNDHFDNTKKDKKTTDEKTTDNDESGSFINCLKIDEPDISSNSISNAKNELDHFTSDDMTNINSTKKYNVSYKLFTMEIQSDSCYDERRDIKKQYKILVRSKLDGVEMLSNGVPHPLILSPKMEHQLGFGAEAATLEESLREWTSLIFNPEASLARVRIEANSGEIIQIERHSTISLNSEIKRSHKVKAEDSLKVLYNVIERLSVLTPGQYIIQHIPKHGSFAYVYKETDQLQKNVLNLDTIYQSKEFETSSNTPWPPIDTMLPTPWIKYSNKMPAMFNPCNVVPNTSKSQNYRKQNKRITQDTVRRSLRKKKEK